MEYRCATCKYEKLDVSNHGRACKCVCCVCCEVDIYDKGNWEPKEEAQNG